VLDVLEMSEVMRCVLLCMLEVVEGELSLFNVLEVPEDMRCTLLYMLEAVEDALSSLEVLEVLRVPVCHCGYWRL